jgi:peroxiredoxin
LLEAGRIAPEFSLKDIEGERRSLRENLRQGPVLAVFFKISCPTSQLALPFLDRLKTGVRVLGISQDDVSSTKEFLEYFKISFPVLIDPEKHHYAVSGAYHLTNVPSMFLIERDGKISWALHGFHRGDFEQLAVRFGAVLFGTDEKVPWMKPG